MMPENLLDYLFIIGKPASGKSTVSRIVLEVLKLSDSNYLPIDKAHRVICDPHVQSPLYSYLEGGKLVFHDREAMMREALLWLAREANRLLLQKPPVRPICFEFSHYNYAEAFAIFGLEKMRRAAVLEVTAPESVIRQRNQNRPLADQVPEEYLQMVFAPAAAHWREQIPVGRYAALLNDSTLSTSELEARVKSALQELGLPFS